MISLCLCIDNEEEEENIPNAPPVFRPRLPSIAAARIDRPPLWDNSLDVASSSILSNPLTWRAALLALRALHPGTGNHPGIQALNMISSLF